MVFASDRRRSARFALSCQCRLRSPFQDFPELAAVTLNISRTGLFVRLLSPLPAQDPPQPGQLVEVNVELPEPANRKRCLHCEGVIVRLEGRESPALAVRVRRMEFRGRTSVPGRGFPTELPPERTS